MLKIFKQAKQMLTPSRLWWKGAALGLLIALIILCMLGSLDLFNNSTSLSSAIVYFLAKISKFILLGIGVVIALKVFEKIPFIYKCLMIGFAYAIYYFFIPIQEKYGILLIGLWGLISISLAGGGLASLCMKESVNSTTSRSKAWISFIIGTVGITTLISWLWLSTLPFEAPQIADNNHPITSILLSDPADKGSYHIEEVCYGSGEDHHRLEYGPKVSIRTDSVDGSSFIGGWDGITGWLRTFYWGFDSSKLPLNGCVWVPEGNGPFPLIMIVHGNHEMMTHSDSGYEYLGKLLASRGFLTVSIDENFLNGSWLNFTGGLSEVPARGWLILEHLKLWRMWNEKPGSPFYKKVNMEKIGLVGHSRGGEAIAVATALNNLSHFPGDGNISLDYGFNIKALAAISPVDAQYKPGGLQTELENVDYLVIHGSHDGDVRSFEGTAQYHRVQFKGSDYHFKAALYIYGANHGQFNTLWGKKDNSSPASILFDLAQIMPLEEQQTIAKVYLSGFFEAALHGETGYLPLFQDYRSAQQWLPKTLYLNEFADSTFQYIDDDKDNINISKTSLKGVERIGEHLNQWKQSVVNLKKGRALRPATFLGWKKEEEEEIPSYTLTLPPSKIKTSNSSVLVLSLANASENKKSSKTIDFTIELTDSNGQSASLPLSSYAYLQAPMFIKLMRASFLDPMPSPEKVFQTFEYPLQAFVAQNPEFDPQNLQSIRFLFNKSPQGKIIVDTIAIK